ncbi:hypothetical protein [Dysgonomonas sp.]
MQRIDIINKLSELEKEINILKKQILKPTLTDLNHIPLLYEWYKEIVAGIKDFSDEEKAEYKQVFLFCILMLYCPRVLMGEPLSRGIREYLANLFDRSPSHVSNLIGDIAFYYKQYTQFKKNCDHVLSEIEILVAKIRLN